MFDSSSINHNIASHHGGGINMTNGTLNMFNASSIDHNQAGDGGGIYVNFGGPTFNLWGVGAVHLNTPNNCTLNTVPNCVG
jgi:predicted outer membrane repeat protein